MCYNETTKKSIMNWREQNKTKYNEICKKGSNKYYIKNRELIQKIPFQPRMEKAIGD